MKLNVYSVRDSKADTYNKPFCVSTHGEAIRSFHAACKQSGSMLNENPEDFNLYHIGTFDQATGELETVAPLHMASALDGRVVNAITK